MQAKGKTITVFEHEAIKLSQDFDINQLKALQIFYGEKGVPYYSLIHNGVRFNEFVGVIQVGGILIEVLPKADKDLSDEKEKIKWRNMLIAMLRSVGIFDIHAPSYSSLKLKANSILDLYFEVFVDELEYLLHRGLVKKYRKTEGNSGVLKGSLYFAKHIQQNITHQERFFVRYSAYDTEHKFHFILYKTLCLLKQINTNTALYSKIGALLLCFPEMPDIKVTDATFNKLIFNRKTECYRKAIEIAKLLLLNYHPDVSKGRNNVLALMFDMNKLWEKFVYVSLRKHRPTGMTITAQNSKYFWKPEAGRRSKIRPDIVINMEIEEGSIVLDTKWKNLYGNNPSPDDLRQMYVYFEYFNAKQVALVYPNSSSNKSSGTYLDPTTSEEINKKCSIISLAVEPNIKLWQQKIYDDFSKWLNF